MVPRILRFRSRERIGIVLVNCGKAGIDIMAAWLGICARSYCLGAPEWHGRVTWTTVSEVGGTSNIVSSWNDARVKASHLMCSIIPSHRPKLVFTRVHAVCFIYTEGRLFTFYKAGFGRGRYRRRITGGGALKRTRVFQRRVSAAWRMGNLHISLPILRGVQNAPLYISRGVFGFGYFDQAEPIKDGVCKWISVHNVNRFAGETFVVDAVCI